ncbi:hypothetical protein ACOMHN_043106 [Nucella lapillus]
MDAVGIGSVGAHWGLVHTGVWCTLGSGAHWGLVHTGVWCTLGSGAHWGLVHTGVWCTLGITLSFVGDIEVQSSFLRRPATKIKLLLEKIKIEDGGIGVIDRLLIDTPRSQQQGFQQRPGGFGGRESRPTFIGRAVRETRGRDRGGPTRYSGYSGGATGQTGSGRQEARPSPFTGSGRQEARPSPSTDGPRHGSYSGATGQTGSGRQEARPSPSTDGRGPDDEERPSQGGTLSPVPDRGDIAEIFADDMNTDYPGDADSLWHAEMCDVLAEKELGGVSPSLVPTGPVTLSQRPDNTEGMDMIPSPVEQE